MFKHARPFPSRCVRLRGVTCTASFYNFCLHTSECVHIRHITLPARSVGGHLHVVIGSTCHCCRRWEWDTRVLNVPHKRNVMFPVSYLHTCESGQRLMPSAMEYDDFAHGDPLSQGVKGRGSDGCFSADWFIYLAACFPGCVCPDTANVTKPKDITERVWTHTTMQDFCQERSPPGFLSLFHPPSCLIICAFTELLWEGTFEI